MQPSLRLALACLWAATALTACAPERPPSAPESVVLISIDTLRADHLGCYGYGRPTSPNLDALASRGVLFTRAMSTAPWTVPAHVSMLTGLYARSHGVDDWKKSLPAGTATLPERLSAAGMRTAAFVNTDLIKPERGFGRGFDSFRVTPAARSSAGSTRSMVRAALDWIDAGTEPYFLFLHLYDVHSDYQPAPQHLAAFAAPYDGPVDGSTAQLRRHRKGELQGWGAAEAERLIDLYDAGIHQLDADLAPLLDALAGSERGARTLVVVTSDHGEEFLEHGSVLHGRTLHEELVHVPLILAGAGVPDEGLSVEDDVSLVDLAPTLLSLLQLEPLDSAEGRDLSPSWNPARGPEQSPRVVFAEADLWMDMEPGNRRVGLQRGRFKLLYDRASGRRQLFDLERDPGELEDIGASQATLLQVLDGELERFEAGLRQLDADLELSSEELEELKRLGYF